ncbi:MAG: 2-phosphosulfolactate phosphatase [Chlorobi bacterium]|nr:2-phosphosulfolactate phosphatase [Chlorobiota bacterium]
MNNIDICISPELFHLFPQKESVVVVVDILRATSSICAAFHSGVDKIIPVETLDKAREYKEKGYLVAAERDGALVDFADFGNSPKKFSTNKIECKTLVFSSTNGTPAIKKAESYKEVLIGSFLNIDSLSSYLYKSKNDIIILCSGWKGNFSMEDILFAGALAESLIKTNTFLSVKDVVQAAVLLWDNAKNSIYSFLDAAEHVDRLRKLGAEDDIKFCLQKNDFIEIPVFKAGLISKLSF